MDVISDTIVETQDGGQAHPATATDTTLSSGECGKPDSKTGNVVLKKKRRRGKSKRKKIMKPYVKMSWQERKRNKEKLKRIENRPRKMLSLTKTRAPFNNNQFLMEIHKPEPDRIAGGRTRDSSFSIDSDENYFYSLPEDEEEFLTKEFSSVYEDAQCERLANMSKTELVQEYLLLEAKYENLAKRARTREPEYMSEDDDLKRKLHEQEEVIRELRLANEKLRQQQEHCSSSADSESDSCTSSSFSSSSSSCVSPCRTPPPVSQPLTNGVHSPQMLANGSPTAQGENEDQIISNTEFVDSDTNMNSGHA